MIKFIRKAGRIIPIGKMSDAVSRYSRKLNIEKAKYSIKKSVRSLEPVIFKGKGRDSYQRSLANINDYRSVKKASKRLNRINDLKSKNDSAIKRLRNSILITAGGAGTVAYIKTRKGDNE